MSDEMQFEVGDMVEKHTGDYRWNGEVRAVFTICDGGPIRYAVAHWIDHNQGSGAVLHIYSGKNLRKSLKPIT